MSTLGIHPRIMRRLPDVTEADILAAMRTMLKHAQRDSGEWIAVGVDGRSRVLELVYKYDEGVDYFFVYHAMTPPAKKTYEELDMIGDM